LTFQRFSDTVLTLLDIPLFSLPLRVKSAEDPPRTVDSPGSPLQTEGMLRRAAPPAARAPLTPHDRMIVDTTILSISSRRQAAVALMIATAMQAFDSTIANVALPQLEHSLGGGIDVGSWVMTSYLCASAVMATLTGWFRRQYGARQPFAGAIALFVLASMLCSMAPNAAALLVSRLIQGAAAGIIQPLAQAILLDIYPKRDHGRMLAIWGAVIMTGPILGPALGGVITDLASWRWIFVINLPLGIIAVLGLRGVPPSLELAGGAAIDGIGIFLLTIGVGALQLGLQRSVGYPSLVSFELIVEAFISILAFILLTIRTRRFKLTLLRIEIFRDINFITATFYLFMIGAFLFATIVFIPALSEGPLGYNATLAGLMISPRGIGTMATMLVVGHAIDKIDHRILLASGLAITAGALALISEVPPERGATWLAGASAIQGIGVGLLFTPLSTLAFSSLAGELRTDAAGVYSLLRQLGCATGVAAMTALLQARIQTNYVAIVGQPVLGAGSPSHLLDLATFGAYTGCFRVMAVITVLIVPGVFLFHVVRPGPAVPTVV
jgi:DHA2 family multidrug resistance protein